MAAVDFILFYGDNTNTLWILFIIYSYQKNFIVNQIVLLFDLTLDPTFKINLKCFWSIIILSKLVSNTNLKLESKLVSGITQIVNLANYYTLLQGKVAKIFILHEKFKNNFITSQVGCLLNFKFLPSYQHQEFFSINLITFSTICIFKYKTFKLKYVTTQTCCLLKLILIFKRVFKKNIFHKG